MVGRLELRADGLLDERHFPRSISGCSEKVMKTSCGIASTVAASRSKMAAAAR